MQLTHHSAESSTIAVGEAEELHPACSQGGFRLGINKDRRIPVPPQLPLNIFSSCRLSIILLTGKLVDRHLHLPPQVLAKVNEVPTQCFNRLSVMQPKGGMVHRERW